MVQLQPTKLALLLLISVWCLDITFTEANLFAPAKCEDKTRKFTVAGIAKKRKCKKWINKNRCNKHIEARQNCPRSCGECGCLDTTKSFTVEVNGNTRTFTCSDLIKGNGNPKKSLCNKVGDAFCPETCESSVCDIDDDNQDDDDGNDDDDDCSDSNGTIVIDGKPLTCKNGTNSNGGPKKKFCKLTAFYTFCPKACGKCDDNPITPAPTVRRTPSPTVAPGMPTRTPTSIPSKQPSNLPTPGPTIANAPTPVPTSSPTSPINSPTPPPTPAPTNVVTPSPTAMSFRLEEPDGEEEDGFSFIYRW